MADVFPMSQATGVLLSDGWHVLATSSLSVVMDPSFTDPVSGQLVTPGEPWVQFADTVGQAYACPMRCLLAVKLPALVPGRAQ